MSDYRLSTKLAGELYFFLKEVAEMVDKTPQTIRRWYQAGKISKPKKHSTSGMLLFTTRQKEEILTYANGLDEI